MWCKSLAHLSRGATGYLLAWPLPFAPFTSGPPMVRKGQVLISLSGLVYLGKHMPRWRKVVVMKWASAVSEATPLEAAVQECVAQVGRQLGDSQAHLAVTFVSSHYQGEYDRVAEIVRQEMDSPQVFGCSGGGIIGAGLEVEQRAAVSITAASLPEVEMVKFHLEGDILPDLDAGPSSWEELVKVAPSQEPQFVIPADPFSFPVQNLLLGLDFAFSRSAKLGQHLGYASKQGHDNKPTAIGGRGCTRPRHVIRLGWHNYDVPIRVAPGVGEWHLSR